VSYNKSGCGDTQPSQIAVSGGSLTRKYQARDAARGLCHEYTVHLCAGGRDFPITGPQIGVQRLTNGRDDHTAGVPCELSRRLVARFYGTEKLRIDERSIALDRVSKGGIALLDSHNQYGIANALGMIRRTWITGKATEENGRWPGKRIRTTAGR